MYSISSRFRLLLVVNVFISVTAFAQGDGPRSFILLPKDV